MRKHLASLAVLATLFLAACAQPSATTSPGPEAGEPARSAPKRVVIGVTAEVTGLNKQIAGNLRGMEGIELLVNAGLGTWDDPRGSMLPRLAEAVPTIENGQWKTFPDGTMETTWIIKNGAEWHDGTPFTSADLLFTALIDQDRELGVFRTAIWDAVDQVLAPDPRTVTVRWKQIYVDADQMFSTPSTIPLPKHKLEAAYITEKAGFTNLPFWSHEFVGLGPYKVVEFERSSHVALKANDKYVLGRPKIDEVTVRFIPDFNTFTANLMAGGVDVTLGTTISLDQAQVVREQRGVVIEFTPNGYWGVLYPQMMNPNPAVIADPRFRVALMHGIDRQGLIDSFIPGLSRVAHSVITPANADFAVLENPVVKYEYDPRKTAQGLDTLGFRRGSDNFYVDPSGTKLSVEIRTSTQDLAQKTTFAVASSWEAQGINTTTLVPAAAQNTDREFRFTYPGFTLSEGGSAAEVTQIRNLVTAQVPTASNDYRGNNTSRYSNPEYDRLVDRFNQSIARNDRVTALTAIARHISEHLPVMGLFYSGTVTVYDAKVQNVSGGSRGNSTWNVHEWEVK